MSEAPVRRRWRRRVIWTLALPGALACALCLTARPEAGSLVAPLLGPWAGAAYGHADCTAARALPAAVTAGACALGLVAGGAAAFGPRLRWPGLALLPIGAWALVWGTLAALSAVNSTS